MSAVPAKLPRDLQARLDVILAKPVLRRTPALQQAIEILVRNAYERRPAADLAKMTGLQPGQALGILDQMDEAYPAFAAFRRELTEPRPPTLDEIRKTAARERKDGAP